MPLACFRCKIINASPNMPKACPYAMAFSFWEIWHNLLPRNHLIIRFFRRETASGFYPWGNVVSLSERVAEGLCGWRHGNSFPMTQSAQSLRQMRSIPRCSKAVFYVFVFDSIHNSITLHNLSPQIFHRSKKAQPIILIIQIQLFGQKKEAAWKSNLQILSLVRSFLFLT